MEHHTDFPMSLLTNTLFWYAVAFFILLWIVYRYAGKPFTAFLDGEIAKIHNQLEEARRLRKEAEDALAQATTKQIGAITEANAIVAHAKSEAARFKAQAEEELKEKLARMEARAKERIAQAELKAVEDMRSEMVTMAVARAQEKLAKGLDEEARTRLETVAVAQVEALAQNKHSA